MRAQTEVPSARKPDTPKHRSRLADSVDGTEARNASCLPAMPGATNVSASRRRLQPPANHHPNGIQVAAGVLGAVRSQGSEVVERVEVDVGEELAGLVADRPTAPSLGGREQVVAEEARNRLVGLG